MRALLIVCAIALSAFIAFVACTSKSSEAGSCVQESDNACVDYTAAQSAAGKRMCAPAMWHVGERSCPLESRLGACTKKDESRWLYSGPPNGYNRASAAAACTFGGGIFTASPPR